MHHNLGQTMSEFRFPTVYPFNIWGFYAASVSPSAFIAVKIVTFLFQRCFQGVIGLPKTLIITLTPPVYHSMEAAISIMTHRDILCPGQWQSRCDFQGNAMISTLA